MRPNGLDSGAPSGGDRSLSGPAIRTFERIADRWKLTLAERERVLRLPRTTYFRVRKNPDRASLSADTLERVSHVLGIYKSLHVLFPEDQRADTWIDRPSRRLGGATARTQLASGHFSDLVDLRRYLDASRGW